MMTADFIRDIRERLKELAEQEAHEAACEVREIDPKNSYGAEVAYGRVKAYWDENYLDPLWDEYERLIERYGEDAE